MIPPEQAALEDLLEWAKGMRDRSQKALRAAISGKANYEHGQVDAYNTQIRHLEKQLAALHDEEEG